MMQQAARPPMALQTPEENSGELPFFSADGGEVPLFTIHVVDGNKCRFTSHGQPDIAALEIRIDRMSELFNLSPLLLGVWFGDARRLQNSLDPHFVFENALALVGPAADGRRI